MHGCWHAKFKFNLMMSKLFFAGHDQFWIVGDAACLEYMMESWVWFALLLTSYVCQLFATKGMCCFATHASSNPTWLLSSQRKALEQPEGSPCQRITLAEFSLNQCRLHFRNAPSTIFMCRVELVLGTVRTTGHAHQGSVQHVRQTLLILNQGKGPDQPAVAVRAWAPGCQILLLKLELMQWGF